MSSGFAVVKLFLDLNRPIVTVGCAVDGVGRSPRVSHLVMPSLLYGCQVGLSRVVPIRQNMLRWGLEDSDLVGWTSRKDGG